MIVFTLQSDYIPLNKLLKLLDLADSGALAKMEISNGSVMVNGVQELRLRRKLKAGDQVIFGPHEIVIVDK